MKTKILLTCFCNILLVLTALVLILPHFILKDMKQML